MSAPELSVVCKSCGSEVSPYVTECPYCGHRLRKRAPELEREGDEIKVRESRSEKRRRRKLLKRDERAADGVHRERRGLPTFGALEIGSRPVA
ncbi:MAG: zinc-ribbon domain-containing protein, partial [Solirubrobacterales bacterium]